MRARLPRPVTRRPLRARLVAALAVLACLLVAHVTRAAPPAASDRAEGQARDALRRAATEYASGNFGLAGARLERANRACSRCAPGVRAMLLRDLGTMQLRAGQTEMAQMTWAAALKLQPDLALNPAYDAPDVRRAWDAAHGAVAAPAADAAGDAQPRGDFRHTPAPEQRAGVALPVYVEPPATFALGRVVVKYRGEGAADWGSLDLRRMGNGWGGLIPCAAVVKGTVRYWIQGLDEQGAPVANSGDPAHAFGVPVREQIGGDAPHLPGAPPPDGCATETDPSGPLGAPQKTDVVEKIDLSGSAPSPAGSAPAASAPDANVPAPAPAPAAPPRDEIQLRGFARTRVSATLADEDAVSTEPSALRVPWERSLTQPQLFAELRYARGKSLEAAASGVLEYDFATRVVHDPQTGAASSGTRGELALILRELYVGTTQGPVSARFGQQRIAWGNSDAFPINDVLNPRDLRDPVLVENDLRFLPTLALRVDVALASALEWQVDVQPFFTPDVVDAYGRPWALVQPDAPASLRGLVNGLLALDPSLDREISPPLPQARMPLDDLSGAEAATKLAYTGDGFDAAIAYDYGLAHAPALPISPALAQQIASVDWTKASAADLAAALAAVRAGALTASYPRRHHLGAWAAKVATPFVLRAEAAYESATTFLAPNLLGVARPTVQGVASLEWQSGEPGKTVLLEQTYERILGDDPGPLLGARVDTLAAAAVVRWTFFDHVEAELRGTLGELPFGYILRPQLAYVTGPWRFMAGVTLVDGSDGSLPHYYRRNTSAYVIGRVAF